MVLDELMKHMGFGKADRISLGTVGQFILAIAVCLSVSWLSYLLFERHTSAVRKALKSWVAASSATVVTPR